ncbi:hypothetical protein AVEN_144039-1 [Araneus ventricosus]|uniref:Uncharacterized protein n=1 Tax=Araneus ventricosus TaxID=182803 RepID=A0A4Y2DER3_ARAVE|nr:hypothetical protein AVEN_144039-1 [Araneus ventricosus]
MTQRLTYHLSPPPKTDVTASRDKKSVDSHQRATKQNSNTRRDSKKDTAGLQGSYKGLRTRLPQGSCRLRPCGNLSQRNTQSRLAS